MSERRTFQAQPERKGYCPACNQDDVPLYADGKCQMCTAENE